MPKDLSRIQTIVIAMMENRSFDHMLGYLGLPDSGHPNAARIEGVQNAQWYYAHDAYQPHPLTSSSLDPGPPHEREDIDIQINSLAGPMKGFVESYRRHYPKEDVARVMEYCTRKDVPTSDFLARSFALCDNWYSCLPASTLPNRLMAMSGYSLVDHTPGNYLDISQNLFHDNPDDLVYDWLTARQVGWRVYFSGTFFFMQMPRLLHQYQADVQSQAIFRPIDRLRDDFAKGDVPQVIFIEPRYQDDYRRGSSQATDDHPPASLWGGQGFLKNIYEALTINQSVWENLLAILTYDEHGSFFDHIKPPTIATAPPPGAIWRGGRFETLGVRVPAIVVSPFVESASVNETIFDHTSTLKLLGEKFGNGNYTPAVDARPVASASEVVSEKLLASTDPVSTPPQLPD